MGELGDSWVTKPLTHSSLLIVAFVQGMLLKLLIGQKRHPGFPWASAVTLLTFPTLDSSLGLEWEKPQRDLEGVGGPCPVGWPTGASARCRGHNRSGDGQSLWQQTLSTAPRDLSLGMLEAWGGSRDPESQRLWVDKRELRTQRHFPDSNALACLTPHQEVCISRFRSLSWISVLPAELQDSVSSHLSKAWALSLTHTNTALPISLDFT